MGFDPKLVARALKLTRGNVEQATNVILDGEISSSRPLLKTPYTLPAGTLDTLPEDIDDDVVNDTLPNSSSSGGSARVPREVREALRKAVIESGLPAGMSVSGRDFDVALDAVIACFVGCRVL